MSNLPAQEDFETTRTTLEWFLNHIATDTSGEYGEEAHDAAQATLGFLPHDDEDYRDLQEQHGTPERVTRACDVKRHSDLFCRLSWPNGNSCVLDMRPRYAETATVSQAKSSQRKKRKCGVFS